MKCVFCGDPDQGCGVCRARIHSLLRVLIDELQAAMRRCDSTDPATGVTAHLQAVIEFRQKVNTLFFPETNGATMESRPPAIDADRINPPKKEVRYRLRDFSTDKMPTPMARERFNEIGNRGRPDDVYWREAIIDLYWEVARANAVIDQHELCHDEHGKVNARQFADLCAREQRQEYGEAPDRDEIHRLRGVIRGREAKITDLEKQVRTLTTEAANEAYRNKQDAEKWRALQRLLTSP